MFAKKSNSHKISVLLVIVMTVVAFLGTLPATIVQAAGDLNLSPEYAFSPSILTVTKTSDTNDGVCNADCSLREAVTVAAVGDTIAFDATLAGQTIVLASTIAISKDVIIDGSGLGSPIGVSGNDAVRILSIGAGKNVTIKNVILKNGKRTGTSYTEFGAAIFVTGNTSAAPTTLSIQNVVFLNNSAYSAGGVYISPYSNVTIVDSEFTSNSAQDLASAIYVKSIGNLTLKDSKLLNNTAIGNGAVYFSGATTSTVEGNLFEGNSSSNGGAIYTQSGNATLNIRRNLFKQNTATSASGGGGAIYLWNSSTPIQFTVENNTFYGNTAANKGGAMYTIAGIANFNHNTFSMNAANLAGGNGGGNLYLSSGTTISQMYNNIIADSVTGHDCVVQGTVTTTGGNNLVEDNSAICKPSVTGDPNLEPLADNGGLTQTMALPGASSLIDAANDTYCPAYDQRGVSRPQGAHCDIGAFEYVFGNVPLINVKGNGSSITDGDTTPSITDYTDFGSANISTGSVDRTFTIENTGAAVLNLTGVPMVSVNGAHASDFSVTVAPVSPVAVSASTTFTVYFDPSAIGIRTATISISNNDSFHTPYDFSIQGVGAGPAASFELSSGSGQSTGLLEPFSSPLVIYVTDEIGNPVKGTSVTFTAPASGPSGTFGSNSANVETVTSNNSGLAISSTFTANSQGGSYNVVATASGLPGFVNFSLTNTEWYVSGSGSDANSCTSPAAPCLTINAAIGKATSGGVVKIASGTYTGTSLEVVNLTKGLTILGGWNSSFTAQTGFTIIDGGSTRKGFKVDASTPGSVSRLIIKNSSIGIDHVSGDFSYTMVALLNNNNGMYVTDGNVTLLNSTISGNHASGLAGSAISNVGGNVTIQYSTIANNSGNSAIYSVNGSALVHLNNTILSNNPNGNCSVGGSNLTSNGYNIIDTSPACTTFGSPGFTPLPSDKIGVDPKLGPLFPLGLHILYTDSPAINAGGAATCPSTDQVGNARPQDSGCDIGAYEYSGGGTTQFSLLRAQANPQVALTLESPTATFSVRAVDDKGQGVSGITVTFTVPASGASGTFSNATNTTIAVTDAKGVAVSSLFTANAVLGLYDLTATAGGMQATYNVSYSDPAPYVVSSLRASPDPTAASSVDYTVTFSEPVTGVDKDDFNLTTSGVTGASITKATGSGSTYTVTVNTGSGNGTIRLNVKTGGGIIDGGLNPMTVPFTTGEVYNIAKTSSLLTSPVNDGYVAIATPTFTWKTITGALEYQLQADESDWFTTPEVDRSQPSGTTYVSPALDYGIHYWRMRVRTSTGWGAWTAAWKFTLTPALPTAPVLASPVNAALLTDNTPTLTWNMVLEDNRYEVQIDNLNTFASPEQTFSSGIGILNYTATTLPDGVWYWRARAINYLNIPGTWSAYRSFVVDTNGPVAPALSSPANAASVIGTPAFSWASAVTATKYQFEYDNDADFSSPTYTSAEVTTLNHTPPAMELGAYSWHVRAKDAAGNWGVWSAPRAVTILPLTLVAPTLVTPANAFLTNNQTPDFTWNSVVSGDTYHLEISKSTVFTVKEQTFTGEPGVLNYTATNLADGVYYWHVRAFNVNGVAGPWSAYRSFTIDTIATAAPVLSSPANAASVIGTPAFSWASVAAATKYQFAYDNDSDFSSPTYTSVELTTTSHTPPAMALGTYSWHARAKDAAGNWSEWSTPRTVTILPSTPATPILTAPMNAFVTNNSTPDFTWNSVVSGNTYQLEISKAANFVLKEQTFSGAPGVLTYTATTLTDGLYYWHVRALNVNSVAGAWSAYRSFTVDTTPPAAPVLSAPLNAASVIGTPAFSWLTTLTASKYQFEYDNDADLLSPTYTSAEVATLNHTPPAMALGSYSWHVRARDAVGNWGNWSTPRTVTILPLVPIAPVLTSPANAFVTNNSTPDFTWNSVVSGDTYQLEISKAANFVVKEQIFTGAPGVLTYTATTLSDGLYYWHVRALNVNSVAGAWSAYRSFTIDTVAPAAPTLSSPANAASVIGTIAFSWTSTATASRYQFEYDNDANFSSPAYTSGELTTTSHTPPTMALGTYSWHVRARDAAGNWGNWSTPRTVTILPVTPVAPVLTALANAAVTNNPTPDFTWNSVVSGNTYQLEISKAATFATKEQTFSGTPGVLTYTATTLADGVHYWHVRALNVNGTAGPWSAYRSFTVDTVAPAAPVLSAPANAASVSGTPAFSWASAATATKYQFEYDDDADFSSPIYTSADLTTTSHTPPAIAQGTYSWHVRAKDAAGNWSEWSAPRTVTVFPLVPATPTLTSPINGSVSPDPAPVLNWSAMANAASYQVQMDNNSTFSSPEFDDSAATNTITPTQLPNGVYYWHVRQTDILGGVSLWSSAWRVTISRPVPAAPTTDTPQMTSETGTPTFTWNSAQYGINYQLQVDDNANFGSPIFDDIADTTSRTLVDPLTAGAYFWRVRAISEYDVNGPWSETWTVAVDIPLTAPTLLLPTDAATSSDGDASFSWQGVANAADYQIQVDNDEDFSSPVFDDTAPQTTRGLVVPLTDSAYFWRVRGMSTFGTAGDWSEVRTFTVSIPPTAPTLLTPEADSEDTTGLPTLSWEAVSNSFSYEIQLDNDADFSSPIYNVTTDSSMRELVATLDNGTYHWRVRAANVFGLPGEWSTVWMFTVNVTEP